MYRKYFKRLLDIVFSLLLLIFLFPIFILVGILCKINSGKTFYFQKRDGLNKKSFTIYKFCSMKPIKGSYNERTTRVTRFLRSFGLDELPQLFNVLKGDMSFIGPRPFVTGEKLMIEPSDKIYTVKPGVISLAIARGRRAVSYERRLEYDEIYVSNITFRQDVIILFKTLGVILKQNIRGDVCKK